MLDLNDLAAGEIHLGLPGEPVLPGTSARALGPGLLAESFSHRRLLVATDNMCASFVRLPLTLRKKTSRPLRYNVTVEDLHADKNTDKNAEICGP